MNMNLISKKLMKKNKNIFRRAKYEINIYFPEKILILNDLYYKLSEKSNTI